MPSAEAKILSDFLLAPAALREAITLQDFTAIFPAAFRSDPAVREMYQELQRLRQEDVETVRQNIADEVKRSRKLKRDCIRDREQHDQSLVAGLDPVALDMEGELSGNRQSRKPHTLQTVHASIEGACTTIETQIEDMEKEIQDTLAEVQEAVGELSDLRYGSFPKAAGGGNIGEEVLATLKRLEAVCETT